MTPRLRAYGALLFATVVWAASFAVVRGALRDLPVFHLLALRFTLGGVLLLPAALRGRGRWLDPWSLSVAAALFAGFALQTSGLRTIAPSRSAFLTGLAVLLVPPITWLLGRDRPRLGSVLGTICALAGLYVLYLPAPGATQGRFGAGDWLTVAATFAFACHLLLVDRAVEDVAPARLAAVQCLAVALLSAPSFAWRPPVLSEFGPRALVAVLLTGVLATAGAFLCQFYSQQTLSATETALVLTLEPALAAWISVALGTEPFAWTLVAGGALVVAGMGLAQLRFG